MFHAFEAKATSDFLTTSRAAIQSLLTLCTLVIHESVMHILNRNGQSLCLCFSDNEINMVHNSVVLFAVSYTPEAYDSRDIAQSASGVDMSATTEMLL